MENKFIIYGDTLLMGCVDHHKDLLFNGFDRHLVKGGGMYEINNDILYLYDKSYDFGYCKLIDVKKAIKNAHFKKHKMITFSDNTNTYHIDNDGNLIDEK